MICPTDPDWEKIRIAYETTKTSFRKLQDEFGVPKTTIARRAKEDGWEKYRAPVPVREGSTAVNPRNLLNGVAVRKIEEIVRELAGHYSPVDEPLVVAYAKTYQRYLELEAIVDEEGVVSISPKTGATYMNPHYSALQSTISNLAKLGDKLGLSIASRKRLGLVLGEEDKTGSLFDLAEQLSNDDGMLDI